MLTTRRLFTAILFVALFAMATRTVVDPDFWWHLRTGQFIVETGSIPRVDIFSFTNAGRPWIAHEWLAEVVIYLLYRVGSYPALALSFAAIVTLSFALVYARCDGRPYVAALATLLAAFASAPTWGVRPQIISLLLTSVCLWILDRNRSETERTGRAHPVLWLLVPILLLWVNLHSSYALGLALIFVHLVGSLVGQIEHRARLTLQSPLVRLGLTAILATLVVLVNPNGAALYVYPFETLGSKAMQAFIQEWFSPDFHLIEWQPFAWLLFGTLAAIALAGRRARLADVLLLAGTGYASLRSARLVPIFALVAAPILAEYLWSLIKERGWAGAFESPPRTTRIASGVNWAILVLVLIGSGLQVATALGKQATDERTRFPAAAVDYYERKPPAGPVFNAYGWGGYLIWRLYPQQPVFIDGRADVYGDAFIEEFLTAWSAGANWRGPLDRYGVKSVLVERDAPLAAVLAREADWRAVYVDKQAVIFQRD